MTTTATKPLTPAILTYDLVSAGDPQISPDGRTIVYARGQTEREPKKVSSQLWLCDVDGGNARRITWSGQRNGGGRWSPDGAWLAFVSDRGGKGSGLYVMPMAGGDARELSRHAQGIGDVAWSPDGRSIAYTTLVDPENPDEQERSKDAAPQVRATSRLDYKQDNRGYLGDARTQVFVVDVASGTRRQITHEPEDYQHPQWSPDGRRLAAKAPRLTGMASRLALIAVGGIGGGAPAVGGWLGADATGDNAPNSEDTGAVKLVGPEEGVIGVWAWSPDGGRILIAGDTRQTYQTDFFIYDVTADSLRRLTDDLQCLPEAGFPTITPPSQPVWLSNTRALFHAVRAGMSGLYTVDTESGAIEQVAEMRALNIGLSVDDAHRYAVQAHAALAAVGEISVTDLGTGETRIITQHNDALLQESPAAEWEAFSVRRGDYTIDAWLLKPPGFDPAKQYPLVLDVHGGPNGHYGHGFNLVQQALASNGFLVVFSNPRGSSSYGRDFTQQVIEDWGGEDFHDLMAVVDTVLERPYVDRARTGIWGYSYGGYMTSWTIGQTDRFAAAVCGAPCFDLESMYGTSDIGYSFGAMQWGGAPHSAREWYATHSPSSFAHRARTPTLIVHGEADHRCPIGQGEQMFVTLKQAGVETEFVRYPGGSHLFLRTGPAEHREDLVARVLGWFQRHLQNGRE